MKGVAMLIERYYPLVGGSEIQCRLLVRALARTGMPVIVFTRRVKPGLPTHERVDGVPVWRLPPSGLGRVWKELGFAVTASLSLFRHRKKYGAVHLHSGTSLAGACAILTAKALGKRTVVKVATAGDIAKQVIEMTGRAAASPTLLHRMVNAFINAALKRADRMVCISREIHDELLRHGFATERIAVIPNAVDVNVFSPVNVSERKALRNRLGLPADRLLAVFSGRLIHRKGVDVLLSAWRELGARQRTAVLVILGSGATSLDDTEHTLRLESQDLGNSVRFLGERPEVLPYLQSADLFVFPSRREGLPNALLEAMATGLPCVASAIGGNTDLVTHGETGLLFESGNVKELARQLNRLLADPGLRARLGAAARSRAVAHYRMETLLPRFRTLYGNA